MKSHSASDNKLRISAVLIKSCSLILKNITSLLILSVVLFLAIFLMPISDKRGSRILSKHRFSCFNKELRWLDWLRLCIAPRDLSARPATS